MRHRILHMVWLLALGLLTTIAVAWGCSYFATLERTHDLGRFSSTERPRWWMLEWQGFGRVAVNSRSDGIFRPKPDDVIVRFAWSRMNDPAPAASHNDRSFVDRLEFAAGWPFRSFMWWQDREWTNVPIPSGPEKTPIVTPRPPRWAFALEPITNRGPVSIVEERVIPLYPILPGLLLDVLFYGAAWWFLGSSIRLLLRRSRRRRRRCPQCGYDISGTAHARCPECGEDLINATKLRRERLAFAGAVAAWCLILGVITTVAVAWTCAIIIDVWQAPIEYGWTGESPSVWLIQRQETPGAVRVTWIIDDKYEKLTNNRRSHEEQVVEERRRPRSPERVEQWARIIEQVDSRWKQGLSDVTAAQKALAKPRPDLRNAWGGMTNRADEVPYNPVHSATVEDARGWPMKAMWSSAGTRASMRDGGFDQPLSTEAGWVSDGVFWRGYDYGKPATFRIVPTRVLWSGFIVNTMVYSAVWLAVMLMAGLVIRRIRRPNVSTAPSK